MADIPTEIEARAMIKDECRETVTKAMRTMGELIAIQARVHRDKPELIFIAARNIVYAYSQEMRYAKPQD